MIAARPLLSSHCVNTFEMSPPPFSAVMPIPCGALPLRFTSWSMVSSCSRVSMASRTLPAAASESSLAETHGTSCDSLRATALLESRRELAGEVAATGSQPRAD